MTTAERLRLSRRLVLFAGIAVTAVVLNVPRVSNGSDWASFWSTLRISGTEAEHYDSIGQLAQSADLVVVGRIDSIERGREWVAVEPELVDVAGDFAYARFALATISVDRVLGGATDRATVPVEFLIISWDQVDRLRGVIPHDPAIFFLRQKRGESSDEFYRLVNISQGSVGSDNGKALITRVGAGGDADDDFLTDLNGQNFEGIVADVERLLEP
ncbi:MAG TPA: hypothetical protein VFV72_14430 [Candidatus Limnocylindrales bacterium]|nr:hypothetical protein [Candidatus Limnocylindrales bacterium]